MPENSETTKMADNHNPDNSKSPFGDNPGKKYIETSGEQPPIVDNLDIRNAVRLRFIEGLSERVIELSDEIQANIDRDDSRPIDIPLGKVGTGLFELHALTMSFFESSSWILTYWALEAEVPAVDDFIEFFRHEHNWNILKGTSTREEEIEAVVDYLWEDGGAFDYIRMFSYADIIEPDFNDLLHEVRISRNDYVHNPLQFMQIREAGEVISIVAKCVTVVEETEELLQEELPIDSTFYSYFAEEQ